MKNKLMAILLSVFVFPLYANAKNDRLEEIFKIYSKEEDIVCEKVSSMMLGLAKAAADLAGEDDAEMLDGVDRMYFILAQKNNARDVYENLKRDIDELVDNDGYERLAFVIENDVCINVAIRRASEKKSEDVLLVYVENPVESEGENTYMYTLTVMCGDISEKLIQEMMESTL